MANCCLMGFLNGAITIYYSNTALHFLLEIKRHSAYFYNIPATLCNYNLYYHISQWLFLYLCLCESHLFKRTWYLTNLVRKLHLQPCFRIPYFLSTSFTFPLQDCCNEDNILACTNLICSDKCLFQCLMGRRETPLLRE